MPVVQPSSTIYAALHQDIVKRAAWTSTTVCTFTLFGRLVYAATLIAWIVHPLMRTIAMHTAAREQEQLGAPLHCKRLKKALWLHQGRYPSMFRPLAIGVGCCQCMVCGLLAASKPPL